jgi:hypothetical protein
MSARCKVLLVAAVLGLVGVSAQTVAQARDVGIGARSVGFGMRGVASNIQTMPRTKASHFNGKFLRADYLEAGPKAKDKRAPTRIKFQTTGGTAIPSARPAVPEGLTTKRKKVFLHMVLY